MIWNLFNYNDDIAQLYMLSLETLKTYLRVPTNAGNNNLLSEGHVYEEPGWEIHQPIVIKQYETSQQVYCKEIDKRENDHHLSRGGNSIWLTMHWI